LQSYSLGTTSAIPKNEGFLKVKRLFKGKKVKKGWRLGREK
jgi:hypothetical protein